MFSAAALFPKTVRLRRGTEPLRAHNSAGRLPSCITPPLPVADDAMTRRLLLAFSLAASLCSISSAADKIKVLIVDGQNNHQWKVTTPVLVNALESASCFTVT